MLLKSSSATLKWAPGSTESVLWTSVLSYLWSGELLLLMRCSKGHRELLTYEIVFQSVLLRGGRSWNSRATLALILRQARIGCIYMPSPMRLLRLCCGKRCERRGCTNTVSYVRQFGMCFCSRCLEAHGTQEISTFDDVGRMFFMNKRTATEFKNGNQTRILVWKDDQFDISSGERIGPVVTIKKVENNIVSNHGDSNYGYSDFLASLNSVPTLSKELDDFYDNMRQRSEIFHENLKMEADMASKKRSQKKQAKFDIVKSKVFSELKMFPWATIARRSKYLDDELREKFKEAPSKASKKAIQEIVQRCASLFNGIANSGFLENGFEELLAPTEDVLKSSLRHYYMTQYHPKTPQKWEQIIVRGHEWQLIFIAERKVHILACQKFTELSSLSDIFLAMYVNEPYRRFAREAYDYCIGGLTYVTEELFRTVSIKFESASRLYEDTKLIAAEFLSCSWMTEKQLQRMEETNFMHRGGKDVMEKSMTMRNLQKRYTNRFIPTYFHGKYIHIYITSLQRISMFKMFFI